MLSVGRGRRCLQVLPTPDGLMATQDRGPSTAAASVSPPPWDLGLPLKCHQGTRGAVPLCQVDSVLPGLLASQAPSDPAGRAPALSPATTSLARTQETGNICNFVKAQPTFKTGLIFQWKV